MNDNKNEIVVFQPDDTLRLEVRVGQDTAWLTQQKIGELFGVGKAAVSKHLKNIFETGELVQDRTVSKMETVQIEGARTIKRCIEYYGTLGVKTSTVFHDRFLILDDKELYLIGASLKDLGKKCFGFTKMDAGEIPGIKARV